MPKIIRITPKWAYDNHNRAFDNANDIPKGDPKVFSVEFQRRYEEIK